MARQFNAQAYGWLPDGTDHSVEMLSLLDDLYVAGGGDVYFPSATGRYRADSQMLLPNNGASPQSAQPNVRLFGSGGGPNWYENTNASRNSSVLDLRYSTAASGAKIETRGLGVLVIERLTIMDGGSSNTVPLLHTTNTILQASLNTFKGSGNSAQDAIILGGPDTTIGNLTTSAFQGYGTAVHANCFTNLNRGVYARTYANDIVVTNNSFIENVGTHAIESDGGDGNPPHNNEGLYVANNIIEMNVGYTHGVYVKSTRRSVFSNNAFWDQGAQVVAEYYLDTVAYGNTFILGHSETPAKSLIGNATSLATSTVIGASMAQLDTTGRGIASNELAYGAVIKGSYDSSKAYPGPLTIVEMFATAEHITIGIDHTGARGVIDASMAGAGAMSLAINPSGGKIITNLPTADPHVVGALWSNSGIVTVSSG